MKTLLLTSAEGSYTAEIRATYQNTTDVPMSFGGKAVQPGQKVYEIGLPGQPGSYTRSEAWVLARMVNVSKFKVQEEPSLDELYAKLNAAAQEDAPLSEAEIPDPAQA